MVEEIRESAVEVQRQAVAQAIYDVSNEWIAPNFWDGWKPNPLSDDPKALKLHLAYADRVLAALANPTPAPSGDDVAELRAERDRLRRALIATCNNIGAYADDRVSSDFLMHIPEEARLVVAKAKERATSAEAQRDALQERVRVLERFVDYVLLWRDRGPPHGDPVTAWSAVSGHPVVGQRARAALSQHQKGDGHGG